MFHSETYVYRESDEPSAEFETERLIAASQIILAVVDYHRAKKLIAEKKVNFDKFFKLDDWEKQIVLEGKLAHEWLVKPPRKHGKGWTLQACCELLGLNIETVRNEYLKPSVYRDYKRLAKRLGGENTRGVERNFKPGFQRYVPPKGEGNHRAKFTNEQAKAIREEYEEHRTSQEKLAKRYGVSPSTIWRIIRGEVYA